MQTLESLGWDETYREQFDERAGGQSGAELIPARVSADFGVQLEVMGGESPRRAALAGVFLSGEEERPVVGDWVVVRRLADESRRIVDRLPRRTVLARRAAGRPTERQVVGANLDIVFIVASLLKEFNGRRIERYLAAVREGGAKPLVVLNKADTVDDPTPCVDRVRRADPEVELVVTSAVEGVGVEALKERLAPGATAAFVGSSGVGKSTLINALAGEEVMETGDVREADAKGRHTTTHRQLLQLSDGALVIDSPGMREFEPWSADSGLEEVFEEIEQYALACRFRDCSHETEPDCAVQEAIEAGKLSHQRLERYRRLCRELAEQRNRSERADWR